MISALSNTNRGVVVTDRSLVRFFWILVAIFVPIFGVSFGHLGMGLFHMAPSFLVMLLILYVSLLSLFMRKRVEVREYFPRSYRTLAYLTCAFVLLHLLSLLYSCFIQSDWLSIGIKNVSKILTGYLLFWMTLALFPRDEKFIQRFFLIASVSLSILLVIFIYRYAVVFHMAYLGTDYGDSAKSGKNQMAVQAAFFFPYVLSYFIIDNGQRRWPILFPFSIIFLSLLYLQSRMGWGAAFFGLIYAISYVWRCNWKFSFKLAMKVALVLLITGFLALTVISRYTNLSEIIPRVVSMFDPSAISNDEAYLGKNSYEMRGGMILQAFQIFLTSPLLGVGVGNTLSHLERLTHNDFATLLMEMGIVGESLFLLILFAVWKRGQRLVPIELKKIRWLSLASRSGFIALIVCLNFFNFYLSPYFWLYLALYIVTVETTDTDRTSAQKA